MIDFIKIAKNSLHLIIYGNIVISLASVAMFIFQSYLWKGELSIDNQVLFVYFATSLIYSIHRLYGLENTMLLVNEERFKVILGLKNWILGIGVVSAILSLVLFLSFPLAYKTYLLIPSIFCLAYVLPIPFVGKRLRDVGFVKIFLIAGLWTWLVVYGSSYDIENREWEKLMYYFESFFFLLAITLPFDIRDNRLDSLTGVNTISTSLGVENSKLLIIGCLLLSTSFVFISYYLAYYNVNLALTLVAYYLLIALGIHWVLNQKVNDIYYSGLLDALIILKIAVSFSV